MREGWGSNFEYRPEQKSWEEGPGISLEQRVTSEPQVHSIS